MPKPITLRSKRVVLQRDFSPKIRKWKPSETAIVLRILNKHKDVMDEMKNDRETIRFKQQVWSEMENALAAVNPQMRRTVAQIRKKISHLRTQGSLSIENDNVFKDRAETNISPSCFSEETSNSTDEVPVHFNFPSGIKKEEFVLVEMPRIDQSGPIAENESHLNSFEYRSPVYQITAVRSAANEVYPSSPDSMAANQKMNSVTLEILQLEKDKLCLQVEKLRKENNLLDKMDLFYEKKMQKIVKQIELLSQR